MSDSPAASDVLDGEFLDARARLLDLAAAFDRIDRAEGSVADARLEKLRQAVQLLLGEAPDRAEQIQQLFSLPYEENWQAEYGLK